MNDIEKAIPIAKKLVSRLRSGIFSEHVWSLDLAISSLEKQLNNGWIPNSTMPEEYRHIDEETGYYGKSDQLLCYCVNDYGDDEYWIDFTENGEWQTHQSYDGEVFWYKVLEPYKAD